MSGTTREGERQIEAAAETIRPVLLAHCYRMLGSLAAAEDAVQETFVRAWSARDRFEGRAALRTWLHRIATNVCLDALADRARRTLPEHRSGPRRRGHTLDDRVEEPVWLEPIPDALIARDPEARLAGRQQVALAFIAALQRLTPRQRAVLLLRDVVAWKASEVAALVGGSPDAIESALHRARAVVERAGPTSIPPVGPREHALLARYLAAWDAADWKGLGALLSEDAIFSMPPVPTWFEGRAPILRFLAGDHVKAIVADGCRLVATRANGGPAFLVERGGRPYAVQLVTLARGRVAAIHNFNEPFVLRRFAAAMAADAGAGATSSGVSVRPSVRENNHRPPPRREGTPP